MLCEDLRLKRYPKHLYAVDGSNYGIAFTLKTEETELLPFLILGGDVEVVFKHIQ